MINLDILQFLENDDIQLNLPLLIITIVIAFIVYYLRFLPIISTINRLFGFIPTLIHELGHAIVCSLTFGKVTDIHIMLTQYGENKNSASGYTEMNLRFWFSKVLTSFAGYVFPSFMILIGIYSLTHNYILIYCFFLILLFIYYFIKTKQKLLTFTILLIIGIIIYNVLGTHEEKILYISMVVINVYFGLMIAAMLISIITRTILTFKEKNDSWDGAQLKNLTLLPQFVWYTLWLVIDIIIIYYIFNWLGVIIG